MTDTIAHKRAVVDAFDEGFQAAHDVALEALDVAKRLEAENERLRRDLDVARAEVLRLTNPARPLAVGDRVRSISGRSGRIRRIDENGQPYPITVDLDAPGFAGDTTYTYRSAELERLS